MTKSLSITSFTSDHRTSKMARRQSPTFLFLLLVTIGSLVVVTFADDIVDGELPLDANSAPPSLPSESLGDSIGASGESEYGPTGAPDVSPAEDGGMGPAGSDDSASESTPVDGDDDADGGSEGVFSPTSTPAAEEEKSPSGASAVGIGASIVTAFVWFLAY